MLSQRLVERARNGRPLEDPQARTSIGTMAGIVGILLNLTLALAKILIAVFVHSIAILADGVNNAFDTLSSVVALIGFKLAGRDPDPEHPYGHGRIENIAAMIVSLLVILIGVQFIQSSYDRIRQPSLVKFDLISFIILVISLFAKLWFSRFNRFAGNKIESHTLLATSFDSMGDVLTTAVVMIPMLTGLFTAVQIDGYIGILISLVIIRNGFKLMKDTLSPLIGEPAPAELIQTISELVLSQPYLSGIHDIRYESHGSGTALMTMNVEVPGNLTVSEVHKSIDMAERAALYHHHLQLILHVDPIGAMTNEEKEIYQKILLWAKELPDILSIRDFHLERSRKSGEPYACADLIIRGNRGMRLGELQEAYEKSLGESVPLHLRLKLVPDFATEPAVDASNKTVSDDK